MEDGLSVLYENSETEEFGETQFKSLLYGELDNNPGADIFYDLRPSTEARKAEIEAYMTEAFEEGVVYGALGDYGGQPLIYTAQVLSEPEVQVGAFNAGPVNPTNREAEGMNELGQEVPDDLPEDFRQGTSLQHQAQSDDEFADYIIDNAVNLNDTLVIKDSPTSIVEKLEDKDVRVHRVNDQPIDTKDLHTMAATEKDF